MSHEFCYAFGSTRDVTRVSYVVLSNVDEISETSQLVVRYSWLNIYIQHCIYTIPVHTGTARKKGKYRNKTTMASNVAAVASSAVVVVAAAVAATTSERKVRKNKQRKRPTAEWLFANS